MLYQENKVQVNRKKLGNSLRLLMKVHRQIKLNIKIYRWERYAAVSQSNPLENLLLLKVLLVQVSTKFTNRFSEKIYSQVTPETPLHLVLVYPDVNLLSILKQKSLFLHIIEHPPPKTTQYQPTTFILKSLKQVFSTMSRNFSPQRIKR